MVMVAWSSFSRTKQRKGEAWSPSGDIVGAMVGEKLGGLVLMVMIYGR
jgi:hypothetical protein